MHKTVLAYSEFYSDIAVNDNVSIVTMLTIANSSMKSTYYHSKSQQVSFTELLHLMPKFLCMNGYPIFKTNWKETKVWVLA